MGGEEFDRLTRENNGGLPFPQLKARYIDIALELEYYITPKFALGGKAGYTVYARNTGIFFVSGISLGYRI